MPVQRGCAFRLLFAGAFQYYLRIVSPNGSGKEAHRKRRFRFTYHDAFMQGQFFVLDSGAASHWQEWFTRLPFRLQDVHYSFEYHHLYEANGDGRIRLALYTEGDKLYFYPFLIRPVPGHPGLNDIETVYGYTGPLVNETEAGFVQRADAAFADYCRQERVICEFTRFHPLIGNQEWLRPVSSYTLVHLREYVSVELDRPYEALEAAYPSSNRNKIRKALKSGITIEMDPTGARFDDFVSIYLENMKRLNATSMYYFSPAFFSGLKSLVVRAGTILHACLNGRTVGSTLFLRGGPYGHYFLSSANEEGRRLAAGNLMLDEGIKWCYGQGIQRLHLGGGLSSDLKDPLLLFKMNFSDRLVPFFIGKRVHDTDAYQTVINAWEAANPEKAAANKAILQRYRG